MLFCFLIAISINASEQKPSFEFKPMIGNGHCDGYWGHGITTCADCDEFEEPIHEQNPVQVFLDGIRYLPKNIKQRA